MISNLWPADTQTLGVLQKGQSRNSGPGLTRRCPNLGENPSSGELGMGPESKGDFGLPPISGVVPNIVL